MSDMMEMRNRFREFPESITVLFHHNKFVQVGVEDYIHKRSLTKEDAYCQIINALIQANEIQQQMLMKLPPSLAYLIPPKGTPQ